MQWNSGKDAGFSTAEWTWLPVESDYAEINVAAEEKDPASLLQWYKDLINLRRTNPALISGNQMAFDASNENVVAYTRSCRRSHHLGPDQFQRN